MNTKVGVARLMKIREEVMKQLPERSEAPSEAVLAQYVVAFLVMEGPAENISVSLAPI